MTELIITLIRLDDTVSFQVTSESEPDISNFMYSFFSIFPNVNFVTKKIDCLHRNSEDLKRKINEFVDKHKSKLPTINAIAAFFNRMPDNEYFYFIPFKNISQEENISIHNFLSSLKTPEKNFQTLQQQTAELFGQLLQDYDVFTYGAKRVNIGEKDKSKRICRFCNNTRQPLTFAKRAHAISEALGNKTITLLEECDGCNEFFSVTIEPDIVEYFGLFRTLYGIKGKGGAKDFRGENFELSKMQNVTLKFESDDYSLGPSLPMTVPLVSKQGITLQNVYKTLCKYFLSVIPNEYLVNFKQTVEWLNGSITISPLPRVASLLSYAQLYEQPELITYIRKSSDNSLPYSVGEFHFALQKYVFIVPGTSSDANTFISDNEYKIFWDKFKHYNLIPGWKFENFSNNTRTPFSINLKFTSSTENDLNEQK